MAQFDFKLEGGLRHRTNQEHQRQRELALVQGEMQQLEGELRQLDQEVRQASGALRANHLTGKLDLTYLAAHRRFVAATQRKAMGVVQKMALVQRKLEEARAALAEAAKQR